MSYCCVPPKFDLSKQLQILNALFNQPSAWFTASPVLLALNTNITTTFEGVQTRPWITFTASSSPPGNPVMSSLVTGANYIIFLYFPYFNYVFERTDCNRDAKVKFFKVDDVNQRAFPLIDIKGRVITRQRKFTIGGYTLLVACKATQDISFTVTAVDSTLFSTPSVYNFTGPFYVSIDGLKVIAAKRTGDILIPSIQFEGLASLLKGINELCPSPITVPPIAPPGTTYNVNDGTFPIPSTYPLNPIQFIPSLSNFGEYNGYSWLALTPAYVVNPKDPYFQLVPDGSGSSSRGSRLFFKNLIGTSQQGTYSVRFSLKIAYSGPIPPPAGFDPRVVIDGLGTLQLNYKNASWYLNRYLVCFLTRGGFITSITSVVKASDLLSATYTDEYTFDTVTGNWGEITVYSTLPIESTMFSVTGTFSVTIDSLDNC